MALDDFMDREVGVAVAATAAAISPRARNLLRQGAVYGLAGAMKAGDLAFGAARGAVRGVTSGVGENESRSQSPSSRSPRSSSSRSSRSRSGSTTSRRRQTSTRSSDG